MPKSIYKNLSNLRKSQRWRRNKHPQVRQSKYEELSGQADDSSDSDSPVPMQLQTLSEGFTPVTQYEDSSAQGNFAINDDTTTANVPLQVFSEELAAACQLSTSSIYNASSDSHAEKTLTLKEAVSSWAIEEKSLSKQSLSRLLRSMKRVDPSLPTSAKTLFPPFPLNCVRMEGGEYIHLQNWTSSLKTVLTTARRSSEYQLLINIDGLPLFKSSANHKLYPILIMVLGLAMRPICAGIYSSVKTSNREMPNPNVLLQMFLEDFKRLQDEPFIIAGNRVQLLGFGIYVCDAPARAALKLIKYHSGYNACERCTVEGEYHGRHVCLLGGEACLRSEESFNEKEDGSHHHGTSILQDFGVPMVSGFVLDYLHLACLGVMRRLLQWWKGVPGQLVARLGRFCISRLSQSIQDASSQIPREFPRKMRPLKDLSYWKGSEFRLFFLYAGFTLLKDDDILSQERYSHFLNFAVPMRILLDAESDNSCVTKARDMLKSFVRDCPAHYGTAFVSYNIHSLIHLPQDYAKYGSLDNVSCFPFESYLGLLKDFIQSGYKPLQQVSQRAHYLNQNVQSSFVTAKRHDDIVDKNNCGILPLQVTGATSHFKKIYRCGLMFARDNEKDNIISVRGALQKLSIL